MQLPKIDKITGRRQMFGKVLCIFFALMFACTLVSRAADSVIVPKVTTQKFERKKLTSSLSGTGTIDAKEKSLVHVPGGYVIESCVSQGEQVQPQDVLLTFFMEDLEKKKGELEQEIAKLKIQLEQAKLSGQPDASVPASDSASRNLDQARQARDEGSAAFDQIQQDYARLEEEYGQKKTELLAWYEQQKQAQGQSQAQGQGQPQEQPTAQDQPQSQGQGEPQSPEQPGQPEGSGGQNGGDSVLEEYEKKQAELLTWYEQQKASIDGKAEAAKQQMQQNDQLLNDANNALDDAKKSDSAAQKNQQKQRQSADYTAELAKIDLEDKEEELSSLKELIDAGGNIYAGKAGTVLPNTLASGSVSSGSEFIPIGTGELSFQAKITKNQAALVSAGNTITIKAGKDREAKAAVEQIQLSEEEKDGEGEETWLLTAGFMEQSEEFKAGQQAAFSMQRESEEYQNVLPLAVLHQDSTGYYCLAVESRRTILGEEYQAVRINLKIEDKDDNFAAVSGALEGVGEVIAGGNKNVEEGDRVRLEH